MLMEGGTIEDWARAHVSIGFSFEPWGTKKTIEHIFDERNVRDDALLDLAKKEADKMVTQRYLHHDGDGKVYVFSKDNEGKYSWQPATFRDKLMNRALNFLPNLQRRLNYSLQS